MMSESHGVHSDDEEHALTRDVDGDTGEAAGVAGVIGAAIGTAVAGPIGAALGAAGAGILGGAAEVIIHHAREAHEHTADPCPDCSDSPPLA